LDVLIVSGDVMYSAGVGEGGREGDVWRRKESEAYEAWCSTE